MPPDLPRGLSRLRRSEFSPPYQTYLPPPRPPPKRRNSAFVLTSSFCPVGAFSLRHARQRAGCSFAEKLSHRAHILLQLLQYRLNSLPFTRWVSVFARWAIRNTSRRNTAIIDINVLFRFSTRHVVVIVWIPLLFSVAKGINECTF